jgi:hypothetical protein
MKKLRLVLWGAASVLTLAPTVFASEPIVVFGLTNVPLGQAILFHNSVVNLSSNGLDGVSILTGEADAGVFAYPSTAENPMDGDYMLGKAFGKLNGVPDQLLCTVRGRKVAQSSGYGVYPLTLDFSALGVTNFLAQVFTRMGRLVAEREIGLSEPIIRSDYNGYAITRINPFWRAPDGAIGVVLDFPGATGFEFGGDPASPYDGPIPFGQRLVLRALNPTGVVEYVSRVDVTTGTAPSDENAGLTTFQMDEMRLGVFGRPHKALGNVALQARGGSLKIARLNPAEPESDSDFIEGTGVHIELDRAQSASVEFAPVDLSGNDAEFGVTALTHLGGSIWYFGTWANALGTLRLRQTTNGLILNGVFERIGTNAQQVRLAVYRAGALVGQSPVLELEDTVFPAVAVSGNPRVLRAGAQANTLESPPGLGLAFDTVVTFTATNGSDVLSLDGDEVKFLSVGPIYPEFPLVEAWLESLNSLVINTRGLTDFTITSEREEKAASPRLTITRAAGQVHLSWPDPNHAYYLQISSEVAGEFEYFSYPDNSQPIATASDTISANETHFYRLIHSGAVD